MRAGLIDDRFMVEPIEEAEVENQTESPNEEREASFPKRPIHF